MFHEKATREKRIWTDINFILEKINCNRRGKQLGNLNNKSQLQNEILSLQFSRWAD